MSALDTVVTYRVPSPGASWIEEERNQMSLVMKADDGTAVPLQRLKTIRRRVEVLGATPRVVTRARLTYLEHAIVERRATAERAMPSPITGKRYVLDATGGAVTVIAAGGAITAEEEAAVRAEEKRFGRSDTLAMVVARQRYRVGEPVTIPPQEAARLFPGDLEVTAMELTFIERTGGDASFALRVGMRGAHAGIETRTDVVGTLRLDAATAQPLAMRLVGPVHMTGALIGDGTLEIDSKRAPE